MLNGGRHVLCHGVPVLNVESPYSLLVVYVSDSQCQITIKKRSKRFMTAFVPEQHCVNRAFNNYCKHTFFSRQTLFCMFWAMSNSVCRL